MAKEPKLGPGRRGGSSSCSRGGVQFHVASSCEGRSGDGAGFDLRPNLRKRLGPRERTFSLAQGECFDACCRRKVRSWALGGQRDGPEAFDKEGVATDAAAKHEEQKRGRLRHFRIETGFLIAVEVPEGIFSSDVRWRWC